MLGVGVPNGLLNLHIAIAGVKTHHHEELFISLENLLKHRCLKWACIAHLDIWNTSYGQKKGLESNWQFDSRPLKVKNQLDFLMWRQLATYHWKALNEGYNFALVLIIIGGLHKKLCALKVVGVLVVGILGFPLRSPETKSHLDVAPVERHRVYKERRWWFPPSLGHGESCVSELPMAHPSTKSAPTMH
jgi:hypothetical protein